MKRRDLIRHLEALGCEFLREGADHTVYVNRAALKSTAIPRHREINEFLARKICRDSPGAGPKAQVGLMQTAPSSFSRIYFRDRKSTRLNSSHANISYA